MQSFWQGKKVLVTGGSGFLGSHIVDRLQKLECEVFAPRSRQYNLVKFDDAVAAMQAAKPDIVIHSAAYYGGIWINQLYPGRIYFENLVMGANVIEACRLAGVKKFVGIGTACSYPGYLTGELKEETLWDGAPHETVINYGLTKKMMAVQCWAYKKQYDFNGIHLILTNLYGPRDTYNPDRSHVAAALIRKFVEGRLSNADEVEVWGTGKPIREFLYVEDAAEAILLAAEKYDKLEPLNIGTGVGTSIRELAETIQSVTGFQGRIKWNTSKPDGQMKKILDISKMKKTLDWTPRHSLQQGIIKTIEWYGANKESADQRF